MIDNDQQTCLSPCLSPNIVDLDSAQSIINLKMYDSGLKSPMNRTEELNDRNISIISLV